MRYIGIDYHKRYMVATVMDEEGNIIRKERVKTILKLHKPKLI